MAAKLVVVGDSLSHGFQHAAIRRSAWSYPAMVARALGADAFRHANFEADGVGGPLVDIELLMRRLSERCGRTLSLVDVPTAALTVRAFMGRIEDYWERGDGTKPSNTGPTHHNLAVWGFDVLDALTLSDAVCFRNTPPAKNDLLNQVPEMAMYRSARRVLNPLQAAALEESKPLDVARRIAREEGGIENLLVMLGANNALGTCVKLKLKWSQSADFRKLAHQRDCTIWEPDHFARIYRDLAEQVAAVGAERVFLSTVPHVTVAPVVRGVSPRAKLRGSEERVKGYYEYYTRFWIWDADFDPGRHPYLTREDAMLIDGVIDDYNECIRTAAREHGFGVIELCDVLDALAYRRSAGKPSYQLPAGLVQALRNDPATAFRVRPSGEVLLDTRYLQIPDHSPEASAPASEWQEKFTGGLFGLDGVHPTTIGYGVIAHEVLKAMQRAGVHDADPTTLPWNDIVQADTLITDPPPILASLEKTLDVLFGKLALEHVIEKLAGYGAEDL